jgi:hypothetical protein
VQDCRTLYSDSKPEEKAVRQNRSHEDPAKPKTPGNCGQAAPAEHSKVSSRLDSNWIHYWVQADANFERQAVIGLNSSFFAKIKEWEEGKSNPFGEVALMCLILITFKLILMKTNASKKQKQMGKLLPARGRVEQF